MPTVAQDRFDETHDVHIDGGLAAILSDAGFSSRSVVLSVSMIDALCLGSALDLGAPSTIWRRSDEHRSALQNAVDNATLGDDRAEQAFQLHLSLIIAGLTDLLSSDLESETTVP